MIPTMQEIGMKCKLFRVANGFYQGDVARATGYHPSTVSYFESGRTYNVRVFLWYLQAGLKVEELFDKEVPSDGENTVS